MVRPAFLTLLWASVVLAQVPGPLPLQARRTTQHFHVDGRLDEPAWAQAVPFDAFVESFPHEGGRPLFRTEARVLYDEQFLYVGVTCFDNEPGKIIRQLGRRDTTPTADLVEVSVDSAGDHRTGYGFSVNAAGVLRDWILFGDTSSTDTWDAVWEGNAVMTPEGWTVELAIPLRVLRFATEERPWGIFIRRTVPRTHETLDSVLMPHNVNPTDVTGVMVSRFGPLLGIRGLHRPSDVEVTPYVAARAALRPASADPSHPWPRVADPSLDVGMDFKMALSSNLSLSGAINPDFGQVEADQLIQNLTNQEPLFPEKRLLFTQGMDIFQPVGNEYGSPQVPFYSRRIGLDVPILAAAKLTGSLFGRLDIGVFDAVTMGGWDTSLSAYRGSVDRRWVYQPDQPLHLGPLDALPVTRPQSTNYLAAVARARFDHGSSVGAVFTAATPLRAPCAPSQLSSFADAQATDCSTDGANVLQGDWMLKDRTGNWSFFGQVAASEQVGDDPAGKLLPDGVVLKPGDWGYGGNFRAGKLSGDPFRFDVLWVYDGPKLDMNAVGYQPLSNYQWGDLNLHYVRSSGFGVFRSFQTDYNLDLNWSADGRWIPRGVNTNIQSQLQLPSYDTVGLRLFLEMPQYDTREIFQAGVPYQRRSDVGLTFLFSTDPSRRLILSGDLFGYLLVHQQGQPDARGLGLDATLFWRPVDPLETRVDVSYGHKPQGSRYLETNPDQMAVFGFQDPSFISITLRQQVVLTPTLTFQLYAQLFSSAERYGPFYSASLTGRETLPESALAPLAAGPPANNHVSGANLNAVLRWEYRLGSTIYLVYTRSQSERFEPPGPLAVQDVWPSHLFQGPATDTFLVKWSYWWNL